MTLKEENEKKHRSNDYNLQKYKVYNFDSRTQQMSNIRIFLGSDATLEEALENVYKRFKLHNIAPMSRCRLVAYDSADENIQCSFDGKETEQIRDLLSDLTSIDLLLEVRDEDSKFEVYVPGDIETRVYTVDINSLDIDCPINVRVHKNALVKEYKKLLSQKFDIHIDDILLGTHKYSTTATLLDNDNTILSSEDVSLSISKHLIKFSNFSFLFNLFNISNHIKLLTDKS